MRELGKVVSCGGSGAPATTRVSPTELPFEYMMNVLRLHEGFERSQFEDRTGLEWDTVIVPIQRLAGRGLLSPLPGSPDGWAPTELGRRFLNDLIGEFLPAGPVV